MTIIIFFEYSCSVTSISLSSPKISADFEMSGAIVDRRGGRSSCELQKKRLNFLKALKRVQKMRARAPSSPPSTLFLSSPQESDENFVSFLRRALAEAEGEPC